MLNDIQDDTAELPSFMSEEIDDTAETAKKSWFSSDLHKIMAGVTLLWLLIVGVYITQFYGWSNVFLLSPSEFGGFLAGTTTPLALIWVAIAYIDRESGFKNEAKLLRTYMSHLVYPEEGSSSTAKAMADAIRDQVSELQEVTKLATEKTNEIKYELSSRVEDFSKLLDVLNEYSNKTINELNLGVNALVENCNFVTTQTKNVTEEFLTSADNIKSKFSDLTVSITPVLQDTRNMAIMLNDLINDNQKKMVSANERFMEYTNLFSHLNDSILQIEQSIVNQREAVARQAEILDKNSRYLDGKLGEYGKLISMEVKAMVESSDAMENNMQRHIKDLRSTADDIYSIFDQVQQEIGKKSNVLIDASKSNAKSIIESSKMLDDEILKLQNFAATANEKNVQLREIAEKTASKLENIGQQISGNTDVLRTKALETIEAFNQVSVSMKQNTMSMLEVSSQIASHTKQGDTSLAKQAGKLETYAKNIKSSEESLAKINEMLQSSTKSIGAIIEYYEKNLAILNDSVKKQLKKNQG